MIYGMMFYWAVAGMTVFVLADINEVKRYGYVQSFITCMALGGIMLPAIIIASVLR